MNNEFSISFWRWLARGSGGRPGFRRVLNRWLFLHVMVGLSLASLVKVDLSLAANSVLLPLAGILIGLCFAWAGNAQVLLQADEIEEMAQFHEGGFEEYVFTYQLAIFVILVTLVAWALAGFGTFDRLWNATQHPRMYFALKSILFALSSLTLRECWHIVLGAQWLLLARRKMRDSKKN